MTFNVAFVQPNYRQGPAIENAYFLPYSVGVLISYLRQQNCPVTVTDVVFRRDLIHQVALRLAQNDAVAFSTYVWNKNYNYALARAVKKINPNIKNIFGGPEPPVTDVMIFQKYPFMDYVIENEGELVMNDLLARLSQGHPVTSPSLLINRKGLVFRTPPGERIRDLDSLPSPYLDGTFNNIMAANPGINWNATLETNRGCPYQCTFCDWGSLTYNKVKKFNLERVIAELEWMAINRCSHVTITDANFGMFPERDGMIVDRLVQLKKTHGFPQAATITWAKNQRSAVVELVQKLNDNGFSHGLMLSLQSLHEDTLKAIKRKNLEINQTKEIFMLCRAKSVPVITELIMGLPEETIHTWKDNFYKLFRLGQHHGIVIHPCSLLENSELNLEQKKEYGIDTIQSRNGFINGNESRDDIDETLEIVCATKNMPKEDMIDAAVWGWFMTTFHMGGITNFIAEYLDREKICAYDQFYSGLFDHINRWAFMMQQLQNETSMYERWFSTGDPPEQYVGDMAISTQNLMHGTLFALHYHGMVPDLWRWVAEYVNQWFQDQTLSQDLLSFQRNYFVDLSNMSIYPKNHDFQYNWNTYFANQETLSRCSRQLVFDHGLVGPVHQYKITDLLELLWFRRRSNFGKCRIYENKALY